MNLQKTLSLACALILVCGSSLLGQKVQQATYTTGAPDSQFYFDAPLQANFGSMNRSTIKPVELATQEIDISDAVSQYAKVKKVEIQEARFDALEYFGATSGHPNLGVEGPKPKFKPLGADRYEVTAPTTYFESLPSRIRSFELGKKSIVISISFLNLDDAVQKEVHKFLVPDTVEHVAGNIPAVTTELPEEKAGKYQAASTLQISKSMPLTIGQLTDDNYSRLLRLVKARKNCEIISSPTVVVRPGQDAMIHDGFLRPFVIGLERLVGDFTEASQPKIQCIEEGNFCKVHCDITDGLVTMDCDVSFAKITGVNTVQLRDAEGRGQLTVQAPGQQVRTVNLRAEMDEQVLMLDPYHKCVTEINVDGQLQESEGNVIALIRVRVVDAN